MTGNAVAAPELAPQRDFVCGSWSMPTHDLGADLVDPNTAAVLQRQLQTDAGEVDRAIAAADALHVAGTWRRTPATERAALLRRTADLLAGLSGDIARC